VGPAKKPGVTGEVGVGLRPIQPRPRAHPLFVIPPYTFVRGRLQVMGLQVAGLQVVGLQVASLQAGFGRRYVFGMRLSRPETRPASFSRDVTRFLHANPVILNAPVSVLRSDVLDSGKRFLIMKRLLKRCFLMKRIFFLIL